MWLCPGRRWLRDRFALPPDNRERGYAISNHPIYSPADNNLAKADRHVAARRRRYGHCGLAARPHPTMRGRTLAPLSRKSTVDRDAQAPYEACPPISPLHS